MAKRKPTFEQLRRLTEQFRAMGAFDPESWARSQLEVGGSQPYARLVFLRQAWRSIIEEDDTSWIDWHIQYAKRGPRDPGAGAGPALQRLLATGASREDLAEVVRVMQWQVLAGLAYQLADPGVVTYPSNDLPKVNWKLFEVDEEGEPLRPISQLHESVLDTDPSGREMRPKGVGREDVRTPAMTTEDSTIADLLGSWVDPDWNSGLLERCKNAWTKPFRDLSRQELATLLRQRIAVKHLLPIAKKRLKDGADDETELYEGELEAAIADASQGS